MNRIIEIADSTFDDVRALYLTNAPNEIIEEAIERYREGDEWEDAFNEFNHFYNTSYLVGSDTRTDYHEIKNMFEIDKIFSIYGG